MGIGNRLAWTAVCSTVFLNTAQAEQFYTAQPCNSWQRMADINREFAENPLFSGTVFIEHISGELFEGAMMFAVNQDTGTWSLVSIWPDGMACLVATGENFEPYSAESR